MSESKNALALPLLGMDGANAGGLRRALADCVNSAPVNIPLQGY